MCVLANSTITYISAPPSNVGSTLANKQLNIILIKDETQTITSLNVSWSWDGESTVSSHKELREAFSYTRGYNDDVFQLVWYLW